MAVEASIFIVRIKFLVSTQNWVTTVLVGFERSEYNR